MENTIKHITQNLVEKLPDDVHFYKLRELQKTGFPKFVVTRIQIELERNLFETIVLPKTEWADMQSDTVQQTWEQFCSTVRTEAYVPKDSIYAIVEVAISDILNILVRPRQSLPNIIFGASDTLEYEQLTKRCKNIVVYRHFATILSRYMEKKGIGILTKERCAEVVAHTDTKLTQSYTPLNWAQMLEPLFVLLNEQIDSNLLRLFFQDKKMHRIARRFDHLNKPLNRAELIEVLSSPDLLNMSGYEENQNDLFEHPPVESASFTYEKEESDTIESRENLMEPVDEEISANSGENGTEIDRANADGKQQPLNTRFVDEERQEEMKTQNVEPSEQNAETEGALNEVFTGEEAEQEEEQINREQETDQAEDLQGESIGEGGPKSFSEDEESVITDEEQIAEKNEESTPIWKRFMSSEEVGDEDESGYLGDTEEEQNFDQSEDIEEVTGDLIQNDELDKEEINRLSELLDSERDRFVKEIFGGKEQAYEEAVREIASQEDWRSASRYLDRSVFKRNMVDMYSEAAVDFTDRLQSFFIEMTKSN